MNSEKVPRMRLHLSTGTIHDIFKVQELLVCKTQSSGTIIFAQFTLIYKINLNYFLFIKFTPTLFYIVLQIPSSFIIKKNYPIIYQLLNKTNFIQLSHFFSDAFFMWVSSFLSRFSISFISGKRPHFQRQHHFPGHLTCGSGFISILIRIWVWFGQQSLGLG